MIIKVIDKQKSKKEIYIKVVSLFVVVYIFWSYIRQLSERINVNNLFIIISIPLLISIITFKDKLCIKLVKNDLMWILYILYMFLSSFYSPTKGEAYKYIIFTAVMFIYKIIIQKNIHWAFTLIKYLYICSGIHSMFIILQILMPSIIDKLNSIILSADAYNLITQGLTTNYFSGITIQPAVSGLFASIFVSITFCSIISKYSTGYLIKIFFVLGIIALFLTKKRGFLVATVISMYLILIIYGKYKLKRILNIVWYTLIMVLVLLVLINLIPDMWNVLGRFFNNDRMLSGREVFYQQMYQWFIDKPIFGVGYGAAQTTFGYGGHNVYLQLLSEFGVVGFCLFILSFGGSYFINLKQAIKFTKLHYGDKLTNMIVLAAIYMQTFFYVYCMSGNPIYDYTFYLLFIIFISISLSITLNFKGENIE